MCASPCPQFMAKALRLWFVFSVLLDRKPEILPSHKWGKKMKLLAFG